MSVIQPIKIAAVLTAATLVCAGCSDKTAPTINNTDQDTVAKTTQDSDTTSPKSIDEIYQEIEESISLKSPQCMGDDFIENYYGIDAAALEEYVFSMSEDAAQAETIIIMKVRDINDLEKFTDCLQTVVDEKRNEMENYIPEQFAIVEKSKVQTRENYVWLVISDNADAVADIIENGLF